MSSPNGSAPAPIAGEEYPGLPAGRQRVAVGTALVLPPAPDLVAVAWWWTSRSSRFRQALCRA